MISTKEEFAREKVILKCDTLVNSKKTSSVMLHGIMTHYYCDKQESFALQVYCTPSVFLKKGEFYKI